jgi:hypothetical protein
MERSRWLEIEFGEAFQGKRSTVKTNWDFFFLQKIANGLRERRAKTFRVTDKLDKG